MGIPFSSVGQLGLPAVLSLLRDKVFEKYYKDDLSNRDEFHIAFLKCFNDINQVLPGARLKSPPYDKIEECYNKWKGLSRSEDVEERKKLILGLLKDHVVIRKDDEVMITTGLFAPPAAMILKKAGENVPQLKKFRLSLIPDVVFVPSVTFLLVCGAKVLQISSMNQSSSETT